MVKRLRSGQQKTPSAKRLKTTGTAATASKDADARTPASWNDLSSEVVTEIARLMDSPIGFVDTYENRVAFSNVDHRNRAILNWSAEGRKTFTKHLGEYRRQLAAMCAQVENVDPAATAIDQMPMSRTDKCVEHVKSLLDRKSKGSTYEEFRGVALNIEYLPPVWRAEFVKFVVDNKGSDDLVTQLVDKAEFLEPEQHAMLVDATTNADNRYSQTQQLTRWASKMDLFDADLQGKLLSPANVAGHRDAGDYADDAAVAVRLVVFSKHLDKIVPEQRAPLVRRAIDFGFGRDEKWPVLANLASHVGGDVMAENMERALLAHVADNLSSPTAILRSGVWNAQPPFCKVEAVYHLLPHGERLGGTSAFKLETFVNHLVSANDFNSQGPQAQLIERLPEDKRASLPMERRDSDDFNFWAMAGLTVRAARMTDEEKARYLDVICEPSNFEEYDPTRRLSEYICVNGLQHFNDDQAFRIFSKHIDDIWGYDMEDTGDYLLDVSKLDCMKSTRFVDFFFAYASEVTRASAEYLGGGHDEKDEALRSIPGHAARCCAKWATAELAKVVNSIGHSKEQPIFAPQSSPVAPQVAPPRYDLRPRGQDGRAL